MTVSVLIAWLTLGQLPLSTQVELPSGKLVNLAADYADTLGGGQKVSARGNVELSSGEMVVRADELVYDAEAQVVVARGNVRFFAFPYVGVADEVSVDIDGREATLTGALFMKKRGVTQEQLLAARSVEELKSMGDSQLSVSGTKIRQLSEDEFEVENLSFTPCDCDANSVTWRVEARKANVQVGERATLTFPVVYVKSVPVFALPWLYLPVTERRSGLLVPRPSNTPQSGFAVDAPVFVTLGDSYDVTLTPGYYAGNTTGGLTGIKGPRLQTEFRYVPSSRTSGRVTFGLIYDLKPRRDPVDPGRLALYGAKEGPTRGLRAEGSFVHDQDLGRGFRDRIDASFVSDGFYTRDLSADILLREVPYIRSSGVFYRRTDDYWTGLDVVIRQDLRWGYSVLDTDRNSAGLLARGPATMQRLPALTFALPQRPIAGPVNAGFTASFVRIAPTSGVTGDEGLDGIFDPNNRDRGQGNRTFEEGPPGVGSEREARMRLDVNPRVSAELNAGRFVTFTPYAALRQDLYLGEATANTSQRGYPLAGTTASSELSKVYSWKTFQFRHAVTPVAEVRYVPTVWGAVPRDTPYDEIDAAIGRETQAERRFLQGVVELRQQLQRRNGAEHLEVVRLDVGQGFDLFNRRPADAFGRFSFGSGPVRVSALGRYDVPRQRLAQISASGHIDDGRGDAIYFSYDRLRLSGTDRTRRPIDALVGAPAALGDFAEQITGGIRVTFAFGVNARYEAIIAPRQSKNPNEGDRGVLRQQVVGLGYGPACDCWRLEAQAVLRPNLPLQAGLNFSISRFGSFGTGG